MDRLIKVFGLQRSGNHAIINWILGLDPELLFINYAKPYRSPLDTFVPVSVPPGTRAPRIRREGRVLEHSRVVRGGGADSNGPVIVSFENVDVTCIDEARLDHAIYRDLGTYSVTLSVIIIRTPESMLASYNRLLDRWHSHRSRQKRIHLQVRGSASIVRHGLQGTFPPPGLRTPYRFRRYRQLRQHLELWRKYVRVADRQDTSIRDEILPIVFDRWLVDRSYRNAVAQRLGYENLDRHLDFVSDAGGGSSWVNDIGGSSVARALRQDVVDRSGDEAFGRYRDALLRSDDPELMELVASLQRLDSKGAE